MKAPVLVMTLMVAAAAVAAHAQGRGGGAWSTTGGDAQRSAWVRTDPKITKDSMQNGGFQFLWKSKLDNQPRHLESLTQPLLLPNIISYKGFKALAFVGGSSDNVYAIDYDLNRPFWKRHLETGSTSAGTPACPAALTTMTRLTPIVPPNPSAGRGSFLGAGGGANAPGARGRGAAPGSQPAGRGQAAGRGAGGGRGRGGGFGGGNNNLYAVSSGGMLHTLNPQTGEDVVPPARLVGADSNLAGSVLIENRLYVVATGRCGATADGVYAIDLADKANTLKSWDAKGAAIAGLAGPALTPDGTLYVATAGGQSPSANAVVALDPNTLEQRDAFTAATPFTSSPIAFTFKGRELVASTNQDGRIYLLDSASPGGADHKTPLARSEPTTRTMTADALATWEESDGTRWILVPVKEAIQAGASITGNGNAPNGSLVAFKVVDKNGTLALEPGWVSRDLVSPLAPAVVNGIVFALDGGQASAGSASKPAVLYALDGTTGKELWNSGKTMSSFARRVGPSAGDSQVYVVTFDGTLYAFGIPMEH